MYAKLVKAQIYKAEEDDDDESDDEEEENGEEEFGTAQEPGLYK